MWDDPFAQEAVRRLEASEKYVLVPPVIGLVDFFGTPRGDMRNIGAIETWPNLVLALHSSVA